MQIEKSERSKRVIVASCENEKRYDRNFKMAAMPIYGKNHSIDFFSRRGWSGGAMVLSKLPVPGRPTIWITVGQGPTALAVGAGPTALAVGAGGGGGVVWTFLLSSILSLLFLPFFGGRPDIDGNTVSKGH